MAREIGSNPVISFPPLDKYLCNLIARIGIYFYLAADIGSDGPVDSNLIISYYYGDNP